MRSGRRMRQAIVKLNEGVSGAGQRDGRPRRPAGPWHTGRAAAVISGPLAEHAAGVRDTRRRRLPGKFEEGGGIVEERIAGEELRSPSVQLRVLPGGTVELLSTHDQLLGGASGQSYLGCVFPADPEYAAAIAEPAEVIGERLASEARSAGSRSTSSWCGTTTGAWTPYAIELNLRKGGTTHPFLTLQFLTDGRYDGERGVFLTPSGRRSTWSPPTTSRTTDSGR